MIGDIILAIDDVTMRFGGLVAINGISLELARGEILGLIGPNGSGKTTLFNLISGVYTPTAGTVTFKGRDLTHQPAHRVARAGIARTRQIVQPLNDLTVRDNVAAGACFGRRGLPLRDAYIVADRVLHEVALESKSDMRAAELNLAEKKRLELARAVASEPFVLLLDEVLAGLTPVEVSSMVDVIRRIHAQGVDVIIIEHLMHAITTLCDRVAVLESGRKIADGPMDVVARDPAVVSAYFGDPALERALRGAA
jgi:branched-chain amino acid transport system ATP-binding protein